MAVACTLYRVVCGKGGNPGDF